MFAVGSSGRESRTPTDALVGREGARTDVARFLREPRQRVLAILGPAGSGKSALLAAAASEAAAEAPSDGRRSPLTVFRLLGTTPGSSRVASLLRDLVQETADGLGGAEKAPSGDLRELIGQFGDQLARARPERPIWLFLDALDQLAPDRGVHDLVWLPDPLPAHVHVVMSALPGTHDEAFARRGAQLLQLDGLSVASGQELLRRWLAAADRTLTSAQEGRILERFEVERRPLWLRLAFEEVRTWPSDHGPTDMPPDLPGLIRRQFRHLAQAEARGATLVGHALGFLAASGLGLSETELLDVLSRDPDVMDEVRLRSHPDWRVELDSLPVVLWAQLRADLQPYLTERDVDGELLIGFYHRALAEVAATDGLAPPAGVDRHRQLGELFTRRGDPTGTGSWGGASPRALERLPLHLQASGSWENLARLLCDFSFLERKAADVDRVETTDAEGRLRLHHGGTRALQTDLTNLLADTSAVLPARARPTLEALAHALRVESDLLTRRPELLWQQVLNRLRWHGDQATRALVEGEASRRMAVGDVPWLELQSPVTEPSALLQVLHAHRFASSCALSADGTLLVTGGEEGSAALWHVTTGEWLAELPGHEARVSGCTFGPGGNTIYTADYAGTVRLWSWDGVRATLRAERSVADQRILSCAAASELVVAAGPAGLHICAPDTLDVIAVLDPNQPVQCCAVSANGRLLVAGYDDGSVRAWSGEGSTVRPAARRSAAHDGTVFGCAVDQTGAKLLTGGQDGLVRLWDAQLQPLAEPLGAENLSTRTTVWACAADLSLERAVVALTGGVLQVWDVQDRIAGTLTGHAGHVAAVAMSGTGELAASAGLDGKVRLWTATDREVTPEEPVSALVQLLSISPDAQRILTVDRNGIARVRDVAGSASTKIFETCRSFCVGAAVDPDWDRLVVVDRSGALEVWDLGAEPRRLHRLPHEGAAACAMVGGRVIVSAATDGTVSAWATDYGDRLWTTALLPGAPVLAANVRRRLLLVGSASGELALLHSDTGEPAGPLRSRGPAIASCTFGPRGTVAAGSSDGEVLLWTSDGAATVAHEQSGRHSDRVLHVASGTWDFPIVSASVDRRLAMWSVDGSAERWIAGHDGPVRQVASSPGLVISAGDDKTLRVWSLTGRPAALLPINGNGQLLAVHPASGLIACGDDGGFTYLTRLRHGRSPITSDSRASTG